MIIRVTRIFFKRVRYTTVLIDNIIGGRAVAQLVEALRYKMAGMIGLGREFDKDRKRNGYYEYFLVGRGSRCIGLTTLPHSCANCLQIMGA
jgi:hypothetical protein